MKGLNIEHTMCHVTGNNNYIQSSSQMSKTVVLEM